MTKMVADWFAGREIATAMAIFVNSWPAGVALSLLSLPLIGTAYGVSTVYLAVAALIGLAFVLLAAAYQAPASTVITAASSARLDRNAAIAVIAAGLIWGLYNVGFAMIFSFGPSMLVERGWSISAAGSIISIVLWLAVIAVPLGGFLADRSGRPQFILVAGCIVFAMLMLALPRSGATLYYATMMLGPVVAGACAKSTGSAAAAFDFGAAVLLACPVLLLGFNRIPANSPRTA